MLTVRAEIADALRQRRPVVALESTLIAHGLPWPINVETARAAEGAVRAGGAVPATIAVLRGQPTIGLSDAEIESLARDDGVLKASRRDLGIAIAQRRTAATTVAATMALAHQAGLQVCATGGIGGAHHEAWDLSADLTELAQTPMAVVCAGAKSILDLPRTLELLETLSVPVLGYGCDEFPAFYLKTSGEPVTARVDSPAEVVAVLQAHWDLGGKGVVVAQPIGDTDTLDAAEWQEALDQAQRQAGAGGVRGKALTPFLLARVAALTGGKTLQVNQKLIVANAKLAAQVASLLAQMTKT
jgi:pseudouridine-5'-phosphate glycosidase